MTTTAARPTATPDRPRRCGLRTWTGLLVVCAWSTLLATALLQVGGRFVGFPSLVLVDVAAVAGLWLLRRRRRGGIAVIVVAALVDDLHVGFFATSLALPADPLSFLTSAVAATTSLLALPVAVLAWREPRRPAGRTPGAVVRVLAAGLAVAVAVSAVAFATRVQEPPQPGDLRVVRESTGSDPLAVEAGRMLEPQRLVAEAGRVTFAVTNADPLVGATFVVPDLGVRLRVPPSTTRRVTVDVPVGEHSYRDDVFWAEGVLSVRPAAPGGS